MMVAVTFMAAALMMVVAVVIKAAAVMMSAAVVIMVLVAVSVVATMSLLVAAMMVAAMTDGELLIEKQLVSLKWPSGPSSSSSHTSPCRASKQPWPARRFPEITKST